MSLDTTVSAIIGGCVAGGVVLVVIITLIIYFACGCGGRRRRKRSKTFSQLSTNTSAYTSPSHSQPSSMGPATEDARLPKVGSNGLWLGSPSLYTAAPSPAYCYSRPTKERGADHATSLHRSSSEKQIPQAVLVPPSLFTGPPRIYHSQQLAPVVQVLNPRTPAVYDVYQVEGSRKHLLGDDKANWHGPQKRSYPERRHSDVTSSGRKANQKYFSNGRTAEAVDSRSKARVGGAHTNFGFSSGDAVDGGPLAASVVDHDKPVTVVSSATDSMKLLVKNKTDDQKQVAHALLSPSSQEPGIKATHGDYSVSQNADGRQEAEGQLSSDNPILACMQAMVLDRSDCSPSRCGHDPRTDAGEWRGSLMAGLLKDPTTGTPVMHNPLYQEPDDSETEKHGARAVHSAAATATLQCDQEQHFSVTAHRPLAEMQDETASKPVSLDVSAKTSEATADNFHLVDDAISKLTVLPRSSPDTDDLSTNGKHITAAAFEFLDHYLSDDDSNDLQSPPMSPFLSARDQRSY